MIERSAFATFMDLTDLDLAGNQLTTIPLLIAPSLNTLFVACINNTRMILLTCMTIEP